jgi:hypothetical protein
MFSWALDSLGWWEDEDKVKRRGEEGARYQLMVV